MNIEELLEGKKPLKFGDQEQIKCIDAFQKAQEEIEDGLLKYRVTFHYSGSVSVVVKAHDEEEAEELAKEEVDGEDIEWGTAQYVEVDVIKEPENAKNQD